MRLGLNFRVKRNRPDDVKLTREAEWLESPIICWRVKLPIILSIARKAFCSNSITVLRNIVFNVVDNVRSCIIVVLLIGISLFLPAISRQNAEYGDYQIRLSILVEHVSTFGGS